MAHGYLLASFLSPLTNQRRDVYGTDRLRFPLEVLTEVRRVWPAEKPLSVRISAIDWAPGGTTIDDAIATARALKAHGCDIVDVSSRRTSPASRPEHGRMYQAPFANLIRHGAGIATMAVGGIMGWDHVNTILASGRADLCAMARAHSTTPTSHATRPTRGGDPLPSPPQRETAQQK